MKKVVLAIALVLVAIVATARTNLVNLSSNFTYSLSESTNFPSADVERILNRINEHNHDLVGGSTRQVLVLSEKRLDFLLRDRIFKDLGFTEMSPDSINHRLQNSVGKSVEYGGRDWLGGNDLFNLVDSHVSTLATGSIDVDEDLIDPLGTSYQMAEESFWRKLRKKGFNYGVKLRTSPYAFLGLKISEDGRTLGYLHLRYYALDNFSFNQKAEFVANIPITERLSGTVGASYTPDPRNQNSERCTGVIRVDYVISEKRETRFSASYRPDGQDHWQICLMKSF